MWRFFDMIDTIIEFNYADWFQRHNDDAAAAAVVLGFVLFIAITLTSGG